MVFLTLGEMTFESFEVPEHLGFGGSQALAVHKLPGGGRIIDAMGRDDGDLIWSGSFMGVSAGSRARSLDSMRAAGLPLALSWDAFCYTVIISRVDLQYRNPWWITYDLTCKVVMDQAQGVARASSDFSAAVLDDLVAASGFFDVSAAYAASAASGALAVGTQANHAARASLASSDTKLASAITLAEADLGGADISTLVSASQSLAQLCCARGYVERATFNLENASS